MSENQIIHGDCNHQHVVLAANFPGPSWVCRECGTPRPLPGYDEHGIRDYYLPGDAHWRRASELLKVQWAKGDDESLFQCPLCLFLGTSDDFDCLGADGDLWFCGGCGSMVEPHEASQEHEALLKSHPTQQSLFEEPV